MEIVAISVLTLFASFVGTIAGFGTSTIMLPVLLLFLPYPVALLFTGVIHFFDDLWKIVLFRRGVNWKLLFFFGIPGVVGSLFGARLVGVGPEPIFLRLLGLLLLFYVFLVFAKPKFKVPHTFGSAGFGGALSGLIAGTFGIGGPVRAVFLSAFNLPKETYLFTSGAIALFIDPVRLATYLANGIKLEGFLLWGLAFSLPLTFLGSKVAKSVINKIPQKMFRQIVAGFLFLMGVKLLLF